jgi:hypothetical protein
MISDRHAVESNEREPKARRAVAEFRGMLPMLNGYARTLTGNKKVRVEISAQHVSATDGTTIFMRPPLALGEFASHVRRLCDRRDHDTKVQLCPACRKREDIIIKLYHEIAHIAGKSFMKPTDRHIERILTDALMAGGSKMADAMRKRMVSAPKWTSYAGMAEAMNPWLKYLLNVLEDARIDSQMFDARPGTKVMYEAMLNAIREEGIEQTNPETGAIEMVPWSEMPMNAQAICSLYDVFAGFDMSGFYHPDIDAVMEDERIRELVADARTSTNAADIYEKSFPILERLRELGYCKLPDEEPEPEPEPEPEEDQSDDESGDGDGQDDDGTGQQDDHREGDDGNSDDRGVDPDDPQSEGQQDDGPGDDQQDDGSSDGDDAASDGADDGDSDDEGGSSDLQSGDPDGSGGDDEVDDEATGDDQSGEDGNPDADPGEGPEGTGSDGQRGSSGGDQPSDDGAGSEGDPEQQQADGSSGDGHDDSDLSGAESSDSDVSDAGSEEGSSADSADVPEGPNDGGDAPSRPADGTPDQVAIIILKVGGHTGQEGGEGEDAEGIMVTSLTGDELPEDIEAIVTAVIQGMFFDQPSHAINGVRTHHYGKPEFSEGHNMSRGFGDEATDVAVPEGVLGRALMRMRAAFSANARRGHQRNLKAGRIAGRSLAKRAPFDDERMFQKRQRITKRDYFVLIGLDISGSTHATGKYVPGIGYQDLDEQIIEKIKRAAYAQAELCYRLGIDFAIYAHTGGPESMSWDDDDYYGRNAGWMVELYEIKAPNEPWSDSIKHRLRCLKPSMANLDGHTLEAYRKVLDRQAQTDKIIMYYTDGAMPAENYDEELEVLQREIEMCKRRGYTLMSVGVLNDDPLKYGLDMVRLDDDDDIIKVVEHLERRLAAA